MAARDHDRINSDVLAAISKHGGTATKAQIVGETDHKPATVNAALKRLRAGDAPAVTMNGNKRGASYSASAGPSQG
jgi:hypothetical protein